VNDKQKLKFILKELLPTYLFPYLFS